MITTRLCASAFLRRGDDWLVMKRSPTRRLAPDKWAPIGGHLEPRELNDPLAACLREIEEETGITRAQISDLLLRYVSLRLADTELRVDYVYFGETDARDVRDTDEGTLHWVPHADLPHLDYTPRIAALMRHYLANPTDTRVYVGAMGADAETTWSVLEDFEQESNFNIKDGALP